MALPSRNIFTRKLAQRSAYFRKLTGTQQQNVLHGATQGDASVRRAMSGQAPLSADEEHAALRAAERTLKKREAMERTVMKGREEAVRHREMILQSNVEFAKRERIADTQKLQTEEKKQEALTQPGAAKAQPGKTDDPRDLAKKAIDLAI